MKLGELFTLWRMKGYKMDTTSVYPLSANDAIMMVTVRANIEWSGHAAILYKAGRTNNNVFADVKALIRADVFHSDSTLFIPNAKLSDLENYVS
jgi:hypothetical protein